MSIQKLKQRFEDLKQHAITDDETQKIRIELCNSCEHLVKPTRTCTKCGCFVDAKTRLKHSSCPIEKWKAI